MPIFRNSRQYLCYYRTWCVMTWLLVVGGQVQGSPAPAYKFPKHVQQIKMSINYTVASSCFFSKITQGCSDKHTSNPIIWSSAFTFFTYLVLMEIVLVTRELGSIFYVQKNTTYKKAFNSLFPPHVSGYFVGQYHVVV